MPILPIVGGSILSHEHFQGGNYDFPMAKAPVEHRFSMGKFPGVSAGIVRWPLSVIRLRGENPEAVTKAASHDPCGMARLQRRGCGRPGNKRRRAAQYRDPIARMRGGEYELDVVLRNNRRSEEHPLGIFHPHNEYHHIKKENIGLIEVMGLAVLPSRLRGELKDISDAIRANKPPPTRCTRTG